VKTFETDGIGASDGRLFFLLIQFSLYNKAVIQMDFFRLRKGAMVLWLADTETIRFGARETAAWRK
jgi:hypothetical protein